MLIFLIITVKEIEVHLGSLRTAYTKLANQPSGSGYGRLTARQREIMEMCRFLKCHIKTRDSVSNLPPRFIMVSISDFVQKSK